MSEQQIQWKQPPRSKRDGTWGGVADLLRSRPGEWALVAENVSVSTTNNIKRGVLVSFRPAGSFEATSRSVGKNRVDVYARYVGEGGVE